MKRCQRPLARMLLLALLLCGSTPGQENYKEDPAAVAKRMQFKPAAVVPALGIRG